MTANCTLLSGLPIERASVEKKLSDVRPGSYAEEWIGSQIESMSLTEMTKSYLQGIPARWKNAKNDLRDLNITMVEDADVIDLENAFLTQEVVAILGHYVDSPKACNHGIELNDTVIDVRSIAEIAPTRPIVVHLGVCRSMAFIEAIKSRCGAVRVISNFAQVDPEFALMLFVRTFQLWRQSGGDYVQSHINVRVAILDMLGLPSR